MLVDLYQPAGPLAVKAAVLRAVELLGASGRSRLYEGPIDSTGRVRLSGGFPAYIVPAHQSQCQSPIVCLAWNLHCTIHNPMQLQSIERLAPVSPGNSSATWGGAFVARCCMW